MSFRKRNVVIASQGSTNSPSSSSTADKLPANIPGIRPSPLDGRLTTSTGTRSLDALLAGHAGLALGSSLLIEESGTTEFGGALLRYYAAEGAVQGHQIHVFGMNDAWGRELPGLAGASGKSKPGKGESSDKMKIAWRYERLGEFGAGARDHTANHQRFNTTDRNPASSASFDSSASAAFCHDFDLSKRLTLPSPSIIKYYPIPQSNNLDFVPPDASKSPYTAFLHSFSSQLLNMPPSTIHRLIIPTLLSPAVYPSHASRPEHVLQFLHALRALLRKYPTQLTALITLPLALYPRSTGLARWIELLNDGVLELAPFPINSIVLPSASGAATSKEEPPQGMLKIHRLPVFHEKGGGGGESSGLGDDLAFSLSRRKGLVIKPFSLPPVEGDTEAQQGGLETDHGKATKVDLEF